MYAEQETLTWHGDSIEQVIRFRIDIGEIAAGINSSIPDSEGLESYFDAAGKPKALENEIDKFRDHEEGGEKRTKAGLLKIIDDYLDQQKTNSNRVNKRETFASKLKGGSGNVNALATTSNGNGKPNPIEEGNALAVKSRAVCKCSCVGNTGSPTRNATTLVLEDTTDPPFRISPSRDRERTKVTRAKAKIRAKRKEKERATRVVARGDQAQMRGQDLHRHYHSKRRLELTA